MMLPRTNRLVPRTTVFGFPLILSIVAFCAVVSLTSLPQGDSSPGFPIAKGVVFENRLWLRGSDPSSKGGAGSLLSLSLADGSRTMHFEHGVMDIERSEHSLWILQRPSLRAREFVVSSWNLGTFQESARFKSSDKDEPLVLLISGGKPAVLSRVSFRTWLADSHDWRVIKLKGKVRWGVQFNAALSKTGESLYVGINGGEWGGGLQRVDVRTGEVTNLERRDTKDLCSGPLNSECDPVTGVIPDTRHEDCVLASVGLFHLFISHGRILRVCGDAVTVVFEKQLAGGFSEKVQVSEAFYGLAQAGDGGIWAIGLRALYHLTADGTQATSYALPKLMPVSGVYLTRDLPGVIVVRTGLNWEVSTSGYTPLLVPVESPMTHAGTTR
jgi:hypothetical protein